MFSDESFMLCRNSVQWGKLVLFFVVLWYIQSFLFMLSYSFRWFLVFLQYYGSLLQKMYANFFILWKMEGKIMHYAALAKRKKKSLALAKSKAVDRSSQPRKTITLEGFRKTFIPQTLAHGWLPRLSSEPHSHGIRTPPSSVSYRKKVLPLPLHVQLHVKADGLSTLFDN